MKKYVDYPIAEIPAPLPIIEIPKIELTSSANLFDLLTHIKPVENDTPMSFEDLNQGYGYVVYQKKFNQPINGTLKVEGLRDYAMVYVNGEAVGELNRYYNNYELQINIPFNATLTLVVENMGRINYGAEIIHNKKGIISPVKINDMEITGNWQMYQLPMDRFPMVATGKHQRVNKPAFYKGKFQLDKTGDTFLDMRDWGKGIVFINGHNLGRYWKVGPQQTLYLPGCWLNQGENIIEIFEQQNSKEHLEISSIKNPILDSLRTITDSK